MDAAAVLAGVSTSTISRICSGTEKARPKTVTALAKALGISARRMQAMCDASYAAHLESPADGQWTVWAWNEQMGLWTGVDEGPKDAMRKVLGELLQSAAGTYAISQTGESLPPLSTTRDEMKVTP